MLSVDTFIKTTEGWRTVDAEMSGALRIHCWEGAEYTFGLAQGASDKTWKVKASRPHQWPLDKGTTTFDLRIGDVVSSVDTDSGYNRLGWLHGFLKRQGHSSDWYSLSDKSFWRFKGRLEESAIDKRVVDNEPQYKFPDVQWHGLPTQWDADYSSSYVGSFIRGFLDGAKTDSKAETNDLATAEWLQLYAPYGGYVPSGSIASRMVTNRQSIAAKSTFHNVYTVRLVRGDFHGGFRVRDVRLINDLEFKVSRCPIGEKVCLLGGILTYPE